MQKTLLSIKNEKERHHHPDDHESYTRDKATPYSATATFISDVVECKKTLV
jgi:hypothetical protein